MLPVFRTIAEIVPHWAAQTPDRIALVEGKRLASYNELDRAVRATAAMLSGHGIRPGDRAMLVCENCCAAAVVYLALVSLGAWPVVVNAKLSDRELDDIAEHCGARRLIYTTGASPRARVHAERHGATPGERVALGDIALGPLNEACTPEAIDADPAEQIGALIYTTGTTGRPKGVMLAHRNLLFVARVSSQVRGFAPADRLYSVLPVSHILGLAGVFISALFCGASVDLSPRFDPRAALAAVTDGHVTVMIGTPAMYGMLAEYAARNKLVPVSCGALRLISSAGAPLDAATKAAAEQTFGLTLHNGYGITETAPTLTLTRLDEPRADCSVGRFLPGIEARLVGPDGMHVQPGDVGELHVRSNGVMKGYYKSPEETAQVVDAEGWFRTGDLARIEDDHVFIVGRAKEMIIRFGFNVYPAEVEGVLNAHPAVARSAVIGRPGEGGEEVVAFVQLRDGIQASEADIAAHASAGLASYKHPSRVIILAAMPTSPAGKILKSALPALDNSKAA